MAAKSIGCLTRKQYHRSTVGVERKIDSLPHSSSVAMPKPADLEAQLAQQLRTVQAHAAALVGAVSKGARHIFMCSAISCCIMLMSLSVYLQMG